MSTPNRIARELQNGALIAAGVLSAGMGPYGFLSSSKFIDGGVIKKTGLQEV